MGYDQDEKTGRPVIGALDVQDAFLQVPQEREVQISAPQGRYRVLRNLPGQRIGAKAWYEHIRSYLVEEQGFQFDVVNPCLGKKVEGREMISLLIHVDDIMFTGRSKVVDEFTTELKKHLRWTSIKQRMWVTPSVSSRESMRWLMRVWSSLDSTQPT